jgi:hypothetical protein
VQDASVATEPGLGLDRLHDAYVRTHARLWRSVLGFARTGSATARVAPLMGSLIKKRRKRMRKKKHKKMLKRTRWQRRAAGK